MLHLRPVTPLLRIPFRAYAKRVINPKSKLNQMGEKQIHQELMRYIDPYARINIRTDINVRVQSADVHEYPDANAFIAELHGGTVRNCTASIEVQVSEDEKQVDVLLQQLTDNSDFHCELAVPICAELYIESTNSVTVRKIFSKAVEVQAAKNIRTKEIRADTIKLHSSEGDIKCEGMLLGQNSRVETEKSGSISFDKLQGDKLTCKTDEGTITTNSCYVEKSNFETNRGRMNLKNVHKTTAVGVHQEGELHMYGVHGNIAVSVNGGKMNLQLSEICGESSINAYNVTEAIINISEAIEKQSTVEVQSAGITLDSSLEHLASCMREDNKQFRLTQATPPISKLVIDSDGTIKLGKLSWMESMRATMEVPAN